MFRKLRAFLVSGEKIQSYIAESEFLLLTKYDIHPAIVRQWLTEPGLHEDVRYYIADNYTIAATAADVADLIRPCSDQYRRSLDGMFEELDDESDASLNGEA